MAREIYSGRIIDLEVERVRLPNGVEIDLELVHHPGAAAVVAGDAAAVILIRQYRHASGGYIWEIPAGTLDADEAPEACARRELREEAGVEAEKVTSLGYLLTTPGFCDERIHLFLARGLHEMATQHEHDEVIAEVRRVPWSDVFAMIENGEIVDGKTLVGLFRAAQRLGLPMSTETR